MMDATLGKSEAELCRCCCKANNILDSLFEHSEMEITIDKILNILAPIAIGRNDGFSQKICSSCKELAISFWRFREMCMGSDENIRSNRKPFVRNNEHDYSTWNIINDDYDIDLSEYLIDTKEETIGSPLLVEKTVDETQNFDAPSPLKKLRRYSCPVCSKLWVTPSKLKRHMSVHRNEKSVKSFIMSDESPNREPEVQCPICFLAIQSQAELIQHMTIHIKIDPATVSPLAQKIGKRYICTVCGSESNTPSKLQSHMKSHMRKSLLISKVKSPVKSSTHVCHYCSRTYPNVASLQCHINTHVQKKKTNRRTRPRNHPCQYCDKRFETPSKLLRHQTVHRDILQAMKAEQTESPPILEISTVTSILGD